MLLRGLVLSELSAVPSPAGKLVRLLPSPSNDDAVTTPVKLAVEPVKIPVITTPLGLSLCFYITTIIFQ